MAYREDKDLEFLGEMSSSALNDLVVCLSKDKEGGTLWTEELTSQDEYKIHYPDHSKYWRLIAAEVQCFGANSLVTLVRGGKGVLYREVLGDVCDKLSVKHPGEDSTLEVENKLIAKMLDNAMQQMSETERSDFAKIVGITNLKTFTPASLAAAMQIAFRAGGFKAFHLTLVVTNSVSRAILGRGIALAGNATLLKTASLLSGPVGWALTGAWTVADIAGPAYRVTIPAVLQVALLRKMYQADRDGVLKDIEDELAKS
jgi:uncharacterized protein YaaW (UPF0174 family)